MLLANIRSELLGRVGEDEGDCETDAKVVESIFLELSTRKAIVPDNVVFSQLFAWSQRENTVLYLSVGKRL